MCGFVGYINKEKDKEANIKKMADLIAHRGPDSEGYYTVASGWSSHTEGNKTEAR